MKFKTILNRLMLIIIILFTGFVFWLGLENKTLDENSIGIVHTNTSGWSNKTIKSGKFSWSFEKVIPQNYNLHIFPIDSIDISFNIEDSLPSANLYATFNSIESNNFSYSYNFTSTMKLNSNYLSNLVSDGTFTQESFNNWQLNNKTKIQNMLTTYINKRIKDSDTMTLNGTAKEYIEDLYPYYTFSDFFINLNSPDMDLYNICRNRYLQNIEAQTSADEQYLVQSLKQQNEEQLRLDLLKKYGEVFTAYPIMIEYLKIDQNMILDRATMDNFIAPQYQK